MVGILNSMPDLFFVVDFRPKMWDERDGRGWSISDLSWGLRLIQISGTWDHLIIGVCHHVLDSFQTTCPADGSRTWHGWRAQARHREKQMVAGDALVCGPTVDGDNGGGWVQVDHARKALVKASIPAWFSRVNWWPGCGVEAASILSVLMLRAASWSGGSCEPWLHEVPEHRFGGHCVDWG